MIEGKKVLGLIPARGGSKGIPQKNIRLLGDKPLIAWTIDEAKKSRYIDRLVVSTDNEEIAKIVRDWGGEVPFIRPAELATDAARAIDVVQHAFDMLPNYDAVAYLQPTSPFRTIEDIDGAIKLWTETRDTVVSVTEVSKSPYWMYGLNGEGRLRELLPRPDRTANRQDLPKVYALNGAVYVISRNAVFEYDNFVSSTTRGYITPSHRSFDLDDEADWQIAECLLDRRSSGKKCN